MGPDASRWVRLPGARRNTLARRDPTTAGPRRILAPHGPFSRISAKKLAQRAIKRQLWAVIRVLGQLFRARACTRIRPSWAKNVAHEARKHGGVETNNTTAHPQQEIAETAITSAPENCSKNAHFSPAKVMVVSIPHRHQPAKATAVSPPHRHQRAKAMAVSDNRAAWSAEPNHSARGP